MLPASPLTPMILISLVFLISNVYCGEKNVDKSSEISSEELNVTTLYPVENIALHIINNNKEDLKPVSEEYDEIQENYKSNRNLIQKDCHDHETPKLDLSQNSNDKNKVNDVIDPKPNLINTVRSKSVNVNVTAWNIGTSYGPSKLNEHEGINNDKIIKMNNEVNIKKENEKKEIDFKPSPSLGSFYDENSFVIPTQATKLPFFPVDEPSPGFKSSPRDFIKIQYKSPLDTYQPIDAPYKFEDVNTPDFVSQTGLEPKPTVEAPVKIPAGSFYGKPDNSLFREKPSSDGDDDNFGLEFKDEKENSIKNRSNPWKSLISFVTALIPVGIIVSALTPNIITLESTDNNNPYFPSRLSRRAAAELPPISERCKRRLLCELHSDTNYERNDSSRARRKHCYKIPCDDPQALSRVLRWLLTRNTHTRHPLIQDRRGYIT